MSLYITRHGETDYNVKNLVCGISDARLTEKGIEQAKKLAVSLQSVNYRYLYVSPLQRAVDTANLANVRQLEMIVEPRFVIQVVKHLLNCVNESMNFLMK